MSKFLQRYVRKLHRWLVLPFIVVIVTLATGIVEGSAAQRLQQIMLLTMVITGAYLYLLPYWTKWQRRRRMAQKSR